MIGDMTTINPIKPPALVEVRLPSGEIRNVIVKEADGERVRYISPYGEATVSAERFDEMRDEARMSTGTVEDGPEPKERA